MQPLTTLANESARHGGQDEHFSSHIMFPLWSFAPAPLRLEVYMCVEVVERVAIYSIFFRESGDIPVSAVVHHQ